MPIPTVGVLIIKDNKVLLVRHEKGSSYNAPIYGLPSGRLQPEEKEISAAVRELREETGLETTEGELVEFPGNYYVTDSLPNRKNPDESKKQWAWRVYYCKNFTGELKPSDETTPEWVEINNISELFSLPNIGNAIDSGLKFLAS